MDRIITRWLPTYLTLAHPTKAPVKPSQRCIRTDKYLTTCRCGLRRKEKELDDVLGEKKRICLPKRKKRNVLSFRFCICHMYILIYIGRIESIDVKFQDQVSPRSLPPPSPPPPFSFHFSLDNAGAPRALSQTCHIYTHRDVKNTSAEKR